MNPFFVGLFGDHSVEARFIDGDWIVRIVDVMDGAEWVMELTEREMAAVMAAMLFDPEPGDTGFISEAVKELHYQIGYLQWGPEDQPMKFRLIP